MNILKKVSLLSLSLAFTSLFSQTTFSTLTAKSEATACTESDYKVEVEMTNTSNQAKTYNWDGKVVAVSSNWSAASPGFCDKNGCEALPKTGTISLNAGEKYKIYTQFNISGFVNNKLVNLNGEGKTSVKFSTTGEADQTVTFEFKQAKCTQSSLEDKLMNSFILSFSNNQFQLDAQFRNHTLQITDLAGKVVLNQTIKNQNVDFKAPSNGIYFANILLNGSVVKTLKFDAAQ
jgi:hypothetical protein